MSGDDFKKLLKNADRAFDEERVDDALAFAEKALQLNHQSVRTHIVIALALQEKELWERSLTHAKQIESLDAECVAAYSLQGHAYDALNERERAFEAFSTAVKIKPTVARYVLCGDAALNINDEERAEEYFRLALKLDPDYDEALLNLAILLRTSKSSESEELLRRLIELEPDNPKAYRELGFVLGYTGRHAEAETALLKAISLDENASWSHIYYGVVLWDLEKYEQAEAEYEKGHVLDPRNGALEMLANAYSRIGNTHKEKEYRKRSNDE